MTKRTLGLLTAMLGLVFSTAAACPGGIVTTTPHTHEITPAPIAISSEADQVVSMVNEQRVAAGCEALTVDGSMTAFADDHAKWMANGGGLVHSRLGDPIFAENLSQGYTDPESVVNAWLDSPVHKQNILNCSYTDTGVAFSGDFAVQVFGNAR